MRASVPLISKFASEVTATVCELRNRDTRDFPSHPELDGAVVAGRQVAVARQRPQREEFRIAVVAQIEHARESGRGVTRLLPEAVATLTALEISDAALDRELVNIAGRHQPEQRPSGL